MLWAVEEHEGGCEASADRGLLAARCADLTTANDGLKVGDIGDVRGRDEHCGREAAVRVSGGEADVNVVLILSRAENG
jgi:hypothetical protein